MDGESSLGVARKLETHEQEAPEAQNVGVTNQSAYAKEDDQNIRTWSTRRETKNGEQISSARAELERIANPLKTSPRGSENMDKESPEARSEGVKPKEHTHSPKIQRIPQ